MKIGSLDFRNQVILAPMAGVTDLPYRNLCRQLGAGAAVGEMLSADQTLWHTAKSSFRQVHKQENDIRWIQILGNDPQQMANAALKCEEDGAHIIDINLGCPAKKVCKKAAGSALLQDEALVQEIVRKVVSTVSIPVTIKIRSGWNKENRNFLRIGKIAEQEGIAAISVHGRTRACKYHELAEYDSAKILKQSLNIPVIVNGDIASAKKAKTVLDHTQADGIMVARAALGNPWLFREIDCYINSNEIIAAPSQEILYQTILQHIVSLHEFYGEYLGVRISRKHLSWYEEQFPQHVGIKRQFNTLENAAAQIQLLKNYFFNRLKENKLVEKSKSRSNLSHSLISAAKFEAA